MTMEFLPKGITINAMDGRCYTCGDVNRESKGQTAFAAKAFEDFLGRVEICNRCIEKAAEQLGFMPKDKHDKVKANNQRLIKDKETLLDEVVLLQQARAVDMHLHNEEVARLRAKLEKAKAGGQ